MIKIHTCPNCDAEEYYEIEVLESKTTQADIEDSFVKVMECESCSYQSEPYEL